MADEEEKAWLPLEDEQGAPIGRCSINPRNGHLVIDGPPPRSAFSVQFEKSPEIDTIEVRTDQGRYRLKANRPLALVDNMVVALADTGAFVTLANSLSRDYVEALNADYQRERELSEERRVRLHDAEAKVRDAEAQVNRLRAGNGEMAVRRDALMQEAREARRGWEESQRTVEELTARVAELEPKARFADEMGYDILHTTVGEASGD